MKILKGKAFGRMQDMEDDSIDAIVTDPPYELNFMGKSWDNSGASYDVKMWVEALRILKPGGYLLAFGGSRTYHRLACAIEDAGFEIRDQIQWVYGSGFPKSHNLDGNREGWGTALKPAHEPIVVARKTLEGTVAANVLEWGTGAVNIDGFRIPTNDGLNGGRVSTKTEGWDRPWKHDADAIAACRDRGAEAVAKAEALGRWPANFIHDGSNEVLAAFPLAPGQLADVKYDAAERKTQNIYGAMKRGHEPSADRTYEENGSTNFAMKPGARRLDQGSAARFFYCAKASKAERGKDNKHPTVKPVALMRYLCRLVTPPGGLVLDPFCGSGTTGVAAMREGFDFIGIDDTEEYAVFSENRLLAEVLS